MARNEEEGGRRGAYVFFGWFGKLGIMSFLGMICCPCKR